MADEYGNGIEARWKESWLRIRGGQGMFIFALVLLVVMIAGVAVHGHQRLEVQHVRHEDALEALVWASMPAEARDRMAVPRWVRERLK